MRTIKYAALTAWVLTISSIVSTPTLAEFHATVHFWFSTFIPNTISGLVVTEKGTHVIAAPSIPIINLNGLNGSCFGTDERSYDASPTSSSRITVEYDLLISGEEMAVAKSGGREIRRIGSTHNVDCKTGLDKQPAQTADASEILIGDIKKDNFDRVFFIRALASDPFYKIGIGSIAIGAPYVDFSYVTTYSFLQRNISIRGSIGAFPAFEGYFQVGSGKPQACVQVMPSPGATAMSLFDFNLGLNTRNFGCVIPLT